MDFGRTGCTADTVTAGTSAKQNDDIARIRCHSLYIFTRSGTHNSSDLHSLCNVIRMIDFFDISGCKTDLVTVGTVAVGCLTYQFFLWELTFECFFNRNSRIRRTGHTHCLIYIGTSGKRISDCAAKTGCRTTERFDLGRMIVCFVLKVNQPFFCLSVNLNRNYDTAGIDLIGFFLVIEFSFFFEFTHCHQCQIHQTYEFIVSSFEDLCTVSQIFLIGAFDRLTVISIGKCNILQFC